MTNAEFAKQDRLFNVACGLAHTAPTPRQASKWNRKRGRAFAKLERAKADIARQDAEAQP